MAGFAEGQESYGGTTDEIMSKRETLEMVRAYYRIPDPVVRKRLFDLMKSMGAPAED